MKKNISRTTLIRLSLPEPISRFVEEELERTGEDFTAFCMRLLKTRRKKPKRQAQPPAELAS